MTVVMQRSGRIVLCAAMSCLALVGCTQSEPSTDAGAGAASTPSTTDAVDEPDETPAAPELLGEPGTVERFLSGVRNDAERQGWSWDEAFDEFRDLAGTTPLDAETAAKAGELVRAIYLPITGGIRAGGPDEMLDMVLRTRDAALAVTLPATPEMVLALDAVLAEWEPYLEERVG